MKITKFITLIIAVGLLLGLLQYLFSTKKEIVLFPLNDKNRQLFEFNPEEYAEITAIEDSSENVYLAKINNGLYLKVVYHPDRQIEPGVYGSTAFSYENQQLGYFYSYYNLRCALDTSTKLICYRAFNDQKSYRFYNLVSPDWEHMDLSKAALINLFDNEFVDDSTVNINDYWVGRLSEKLYIIFLHDKNYCGGSAGCWPSLYSYQNNKLIKIDDFGAIDCDYQETSALCSRTFDDNH